MSTAYTSVPSLDKLSGQRVGGRYQVLSEVGRGGLGTVYRARDELLDRVVALKILLPRFSKDPRFGAMLRDEARITARLTHPGIVSIFDFGEGPSQVYMVTEFISGRSLKQILAIQHVLPLQFTLPIVNRIAEALRYAHSRSVIHLDIKPSNILIADDGRVLLSDFGLAMAAGQSGAERGFVAGTAAYMSPEQASGKQLDLRSDICSLGITIYELLAGSRPFTNDPTRFDQIRSAAGTRIVRPLGQHVPEKLANVVMTALANEPVNRFASMDALLEALHAAIVIPDTVTTPQCVLEATAIAAPADDTGVYESERVPLHEPVFASYVIRGSILAQSLDERPAELPPPVPENEEHMVAATIPDSVVESSPSVREQFLLLDKIVAGSPAWRDRPAGPGSGNAPELLMILGPDGKKSAHPLTGERLVVGRSSSVELYFPDDAGLSRQQCAFVRDGDQWIIEDLGSKNGTLLNGITVKSPQVLRLGDRVMAGHLVMDLSAVEDAARNVVVFAGAERDETTGFTVNLESALAKPDSKAVAMQALIRAGQELSQNKPLNELFRVILDLSLKAVNAQRGAVLLLEGETLVAHASQGEGFRISAAVRDRVLNEKNSILVRDTQIDDVLKGRMSIVEQKVKTMMAVPLQTKDRIIGLIYVDSPLQLREFTKDDLNLLTVMANVAAIRIETARLDLIEQAERMMQRDLAQAAEIQARLLPERAPTIPGLDLAGYNSPCRTVGSDYYDFFPYTDGRVAMVVADVSGKGMPAALMMTRLQAHVKSLAARPDNLADTMVQINKLTCEGAPSNRFITLFLCRIDPARGELAYANAGHNPPILMSASGDMQLLEAGGPPLGLLPSAAYSEQRMGLNKGDMLVLYSDGVTEAGNPNYDDEFAEDRLIQVLREHRTASAKDVMDAVIKALADFVNGAIQADDITLVIARRTA